MKCCKCGKEINYVMVDHFNFDGSDSYCKMEIEEFDDGEGITGAVFETSENWCGCGLSETEYPDTIVCPECGDYPFSSKEVHAENVVRVTCFNKEEIKNA